MATTTEEWIEVHSPYNGEVVGRAPKSGADDARRAVDAAARALVSPLPAHERAAILDRAAAPAARAARGDRPHDRRARRPSRSRPRASRRRERCRTFTFAAAEARKLAGEVIPLDAPRPAQGKLGFTIRVPSGWSPRSRRSTSRSTWWRTRSRRRSRPGAGWCSSPPQTPLIRDRWSRELHRGRAAARMAVGPRRRARPIGDVLVADERVGLLTFTGSRRVGWDLTRGRALASASRSSSATRPR